MVRRRAPFVVGLLALAFLLVRGPLHKVTFSLPVSNDDAILLLMARHILKGELATILWNQPYNGALDAYLLAPFLGLFGHHLGFRLYELVCAALLVLLVFRLARHLGGTRAGLAGAFVAACGTPYMGLMTATGPPPNFLMPLVTGFPLAAVLLARERDEPPRPAALVAIGLVAGLAIWNSSLAVPAFAGMAAGLLLAGARPKIALWPALIGLAVGAAPLLLARLIGASGSPIETASSAVTALRPRWLWMSGLQDLASALTALLGLQVPLVVDGPERANLPLALLLPLVVALVALLATGAGSGRALPLLGWAGALAGAFALSRRTGPDDLRYLYGLHAPLLALVAAGLARVWAWQPPAAPILAAFLLVPWIYGDHVLAARWSDPAQAVRVWQVPSIDAPLEALRPAKVVSVYASLQFAGRLTLESGGAIVASQAWNERIPGDPLRFRDEVDLDPRPAWVLHDKLSRGMPRPGGFRESLHDLGGTWKEEPAGDFVVFRDFSPPYDESRPVPAADIAVTTLASEAPGAAVLDRDPATAWTARDGLAKGSGLVVRLARARRLGALVLLVDLERSPLAVPWVAQVDGALVASGPARHGYQWVNGAPRAAKQALLAVPLGERAASEVRLVFQGAGPPLAVGEVFLYGPDENEQPRAGAAAAEKGFAAARAGDWTAALAAYAEAVRLEPGRASHHAAWARAHWREPKRRRLDVESLDDGGPDLVEAR
jgi:hypothetical protein